MRLATRIETLRTQRETLEKARGDGVLRVQFEDYAVTYFTPEQIAKAISAIDREIAGEEARTSGNRVPVFATARILRG